MCLRACLLLFLLLPSAAIGGEKVGEVVRHEGKVVIYRQGGVRAEKVKKEGIPVEIKDVVTTHAGSQAWLLFGQDRILLKEDSSLRVTGEEKTGVERGSVLFDIRKRADTRGLQIVSPTATIGVKGTRFAVVNEGGRLSIFLKEGTLEVQSVGKEFQRYGNSPQGEFEEMRESMRADFEASREKMRSEFERSREAMQQGDFELVNSFDMEAGMAIGIDGRDVRPLEFPDWLEEEFKLLDRFPAEQ